MKRFETRASSSTSRIETLIIPSLRRFGAATVIGRTLFFRLQPTVSRWPSLDWEERALSRSVDLRPQQLPLIVRQKASGSAYALNPAPSCQDFFPVACGITRM